MAYIFECYLCKGSNTHRFGLEMVKSTTTGERNNFSIERRERAEEEMRREEAERDMAGLAAKQHGPLGS